MRKVINLFLLICMVTAFLLFGEFSFAQGQMGEAVFSSEKKVIKTPFSYVENCGQVNDEAVKYLSGVNTSTKTFFSIEGIYCYLGDSSVEFEIQGADFSNLDALDKCVEVYSYETPRFSGNNIGTFKRVIYSQIYEGIDLEFIPKADGDKYTFILSSGVDYKKIRFRLTGSGLNFKGIDGTGTLCYEIDGGIIQEKAPYCYQLDELGNEKEVFCEYKAFENGFIGYEIGSYDKNRKLYIDPERAWVFLGGPSSSWVSPSRSAIDTDGNVYVIGYVGGFNNFCGSSNRFSEGNVTDDTRNMFIVKINPNGERQWSYVAGSDDDIYFYSVDVDNRGGVYVSGYCNAADSICGTAAPKITEGVVDPTDSLNGDGFVLKLNANARRQWIYIISSISNAVGKLAYESAFDLKASKDKFIYVTGLTSEGNDLCGSAKRFSKGAVSSGTTVTFVIKLDRNGVRQWTFLAGGCRSEGWAIDVDRSGCVYTQSSIYDANNFCGGPNIIEGVVDSPDIGIFKLTKKGQYLWSFAGCAGSSSGDEYPGDLTVDNVGNIYAVGSTYRADNFCENSSKIVEGVIGSDRNSSGYVLRLNRGGRRLWTFIIAGSEFASVSAKAIILNGGSIYVVGSCSDSANLCNDENRIIDGPSPSSVDPYCIKMSLAGEREWTYIPVNESVSQVDYGEGVCADSQGNVYISG
ncbi:MAG: hypothetical protein ABIB11_05230, partial [Candidatus Omnitrophota bacterium]